MQIITKKSIERKLIKWRVYYILNESGSKKRNIQKKWWWVREESEDCSCSGVTFRIIRELRRENDGLDASWVEIGDEEQETFDNNSFGGVSEDLTWDDPWRWSAKKTSDVGFEASHSSTRRAAGPWHHPSFSWSKGDDTQGTPMPPHAGKAVAKWI